MIEKLRKIKQDFLEKISQINDLDGVKEIKIELLGKKGVFSEIFKNLKSFEEEKKIEAGKYINEVKEDLTIKINEAQQKILNRIKQEKLNSEKIDVSIPSCPYTGTLHPVTIVINELIEIMQELSFDVVDGPEVEFAKLNFDDLNISKDHPSRDLSDTFYLSDDIVLRTQTSPVQIRYMKEHTPPFRMVSIGKVYRPDYDISHTPMFHQMEGLMIGEDVSFSNFKAILETIIKRLFGKDKKVRFRPHFFPFTEPSAELDVEYNNSKTGWLEVFGAGMVNIKVLENVNLDGKKYQGFAFGMGIERIAMVKFGIDDLRTFYENNNKFLEQFK